MNQKKPALSQKALLIPLTAVAIVGAIAIGYLIGKKEDPSAGNAAIIPGAPPVVAPTPPAPAQSTPASPAAPQNTGLTPAELAEGKNVPPTLPDASGDYQIVAVIEGEEANRKLTSSLQVVGAQRQRLLGLSRQYDQTPAASVQQRELIAGEILKARNILAQNLQFMAQRYGYSLRFNYRLVPHAASLFLISTGEDGKPSSEKIHEFTDSNSYESFQKMRDDYLLLSVKESKKTVTDPTEDAASAPQEEGQPAPGADSAATPTEGIGAPATKAPSNPEEPAVEPTEEAKDSSPGALDPAESSEVALTAEMTALRQRLIESYSYDPLKNHQLNFTKTALYARPGNR